MSAVAGQQGIAPTMGTVTLERLIRTIVGAIPCGCPYNGGSPLCTKARSPIKMLRILKGAGVVANNFARLLHFP
ncbi:MAG: hypothetical protein E6J34_02745 [Chloroflexi bacterium]|nr:MAG: hypothetical protein E6J34_02745 [Chloroflexota bacterium]